MTETLDRGAIAPVPFGLYARDFDGFSQALGQSFARYGFAVISDHGLDQARIDKAVADAKAFFALSDEVKRHYKIEGISGQRGYTPFGVETAKGEAHYDLKEFWHVGRELPPGHPYRARMPDNVWCRSLMGVFDVIFARLQKPDARKVLESWLEYKNR